MCISSTHNVPLLCSGLLSGQDEGHTSPRWPSAGWPGVGRERNYRQKLTITKMNKLQILVQLLRSLKTMFLRFIFTYIYNVLSINNRCLAT